MNSAKLLVIAMTLLTAAYILSCSDDSPNGPGTNTADYVVYGWARSGARADCFGYHIRTGLIDSFPLPDSFYDELHVSPDGRRLFIVRTDRISVMDLSSRIITQDLPYDYTMNMSFSPDGTLMAVMYAGGLKVLSVSNYTVVYQHADRTIGGVFSHDNKLFYCGFNDGGACIQLDRGSILWRGRRKMPFDYRMLITPDDSRLVAGRLWVYDIERDSVLFSRVISYGDGTISSSRDGSKVYITAAGDLDWGAAPYTLAVYDIQANRMLDSVVVLSAGLGVTCPKNDYVPCLDLVTTPRGYIVASGGSEGGGGGRHWSGLVVYDPENPRGATFVCTGKWLWFLTCQTLP